MSLTRISRRIRLNFANGDGNNRPKTKQAQVTAAVHYDPDEFAARAGRTNSPFPPNGQRGEFSFASGDAVILIAPEENVGGRNGQVATASLNGLTREQVWDPLDLSSRVFGIAYSYVPATAASSGVEGVAVIVQGSCFIDFGNFKQGDRIVWVAVAPGSGFGESSSSRPNPQTIDGLMVERFVMQPVVESTFPVPQIMKNNIANLSAIAGTPGGTGKLYANVSKALQAVTTATFTQSLVAAAESGLLTRLVAAARGAPLTAAYVNEFISEAVYVREDSDAIGAAMQTFGAVVTGTPVVRRVTSNAAMKAAQALASAWVGLLAANLALWNKWKEGKRAVVLDGPSASGTNIALI